MLVFVVGSFSTCYEGSPRVKTSKQANACFWGVPKTSKNKQNKHLLDLENIGYPIHRSLLVLVHHFRVDLRRGELAVPQ